ncbi:MAG: MMPL family transporter, partial [Spirochaetales bacterium]|nr:MMPL family transporter [Spirochaetales bacterium]
LVGMKLNILNIIMIPLVIGMGIDFGIHLSHRFQVEQDIDAVYRYTGKAVFLSAMTTMIGFGSLGLIGKFPSLASMGMILFVGIASCLAAALIVLPALLSFGNNGNGKGDNK